MPLIEDCDLTQLGHIRRMLNNARPDEEGMRRTIAWYQEQLERASRA